jgi:hypothetical protein
MHVMHASLLHACAPAGDTWARFAWHAIRRAAAARAFESLLACVQPGGEDAREHCALPAVRTCSYVVPCRQLPEQVPPASCGFGRLKHALVPSPNTLHA